MAAEGVEPAAAPCTGTEATAERAALTAAVAAVAALTTKTTALQDPAGQKAPTEAPAVPVGSMADQKEKPEAPARIPSEKG